MAETLADRAWLAYHSLPRNSRGKPPSYRSLEQKHALSGGTLSRLMIGDRAEHSYDVRIGIAEALGVSVDYLWKGSGTAPVPRLPVPPRLPYLVEQNEATGSPERAATALDRARFFLDRVAEVSPGANVFELLARAQVLAIQSAEKT